MADLPQEVVERAVELTRRAEATPDENEAAAYRADRDRLLDEHGFIARVREDDDGAVLVCYPDEWVEDGTVQFERIDDTERAVERSLSGGLDVDWETIAARNDAIAEAVADEHGEPHASTARALADYASNHHATPIDRLTEAQLAEFREEYFPRNAWPTDEQAAALDRSIAVVREECESASDAPPD